MTTYLVIVNNKCIIGVQSTSTGGAEHVILDNIHHATTAQAFDPITEAKNYSWAFNNCIISSYEELIKADNKLLADEMSNYNTLLDNVMYCESEIKKLRDQLKSHMEYLEEAKTEAKDYRISHNLQRGYTAPEKIETLRNC